MRLATVRAAMMLIYRRAQSGTEGSRKSERAGRYLVGFETLDALLLLLFAQDDEGSSVFVECETHLLHAYRG